MMTIILSCDVMVISSNRNFPSSIYVHIVVRRRDELDTIQLNNVSILEAGTTWQAPPGVPAGTKCIFMKQRPLLDLVTGTFSFIERLDGGW